MYNFNIITVSYNDDHEYRETICELFNIVNEEETDQQFTQVLDWIYSKTKDQPLFQIVYIKAASFMLSENPEIGLSILFAYDYLPFFHKMLKAFDGNQLDENHTSYVNLYKKLFS
jgi:hypothetical protein